MVKKNVAIIVTIIAFISGVLSLVRHQQVEAELGETYDAGKTGFPLVSQKFGIFRPTATQYEEAYRSGAYMRESNMVYDSGTNTNGRFPFFG